ncbi:MAG: hypothetical protein JSW08_01690 [archaeon]|nr:MAG: hypothetical protein JSW08_01690 [archaeon]
MGKRRRKTKKSPEGLDSYVLEVRETHSTMDKGRLVEEPMGGVQPHYLLLIRPGYAESTVPGRVIYSLPVRSNVGREKLIYLAPGMVPIHDALAAGKISEDEAVQRFEKVGEGLRRRKQPIKIPTGGLAWILDQKKTNLRLSPA